MLLYADRVVRFMAWLRASASTGFLGMFMPPPLHKGYLYFIGIHSTHPPIHRFCTISLLHNAISSSIGIGIGH